MRPNNPDVIVNILEAKAAAREREAGLLALVERLRGAAELAECYAKVLRYELESRNPETFPGSEDQAEVDGDLAKIAEVLALSPPAALDDLRRQERSIGAEEELRRIIYELVGSHSGPSRTTLTAGELDARADAIAAERKEGGT